MERPQHEVLGVASKNKQGRVTGLVIVIGLHAVIITALVLGMTNSALRKDVLDISASVIGKKALVRPPPTIAAPPPQIEIAAPPPPPPVVKAVVAAPPPPPPTPPKEIAKTHTIPPYPALSQRLGEQGTTRLKVTVGVDGKPTEVTIDNSSGSTRLDAAALQYVKENYTWEPATRDGKPVSDTILVNIVWDLKNAQ